MGATNTGVREAKDGGAVIKDSHERCNGMTALLARVGDKWTILVVAKLSGRSLRYNELRREIGDISQRMLTLTLKALERDGLVKRTMFPTIPPRVDYELTELGRGLKRSLDPLYVWAGENRGAIFAAREQFDL